jgi:hypothetical protein
MNRLSDFTATLEHRLLTRTFVAAALAGWTSKGDPSVRRAHLERAVGARLADLIMTKAAVAPFTTSDAPGAAQPGAAFLAAVQRRSALGRLAEAIRTGVNLTGRLTTTAPTATWVTEGAVKPVTAMAFAAADLSPRKVISTIAVSDELARAVAPETLDSVTGMLVSAVAGAIDTAAFDPTNDGSGGAPAALTDGATEVTASGGDIQTDIGALLGAISDGAPVAPYLVCGWVTAARLAHVLRDLQALGVGVLVTPGASPYLVAVDAAGVAIADAGVRLVAGTHADLLMSDGASPAGTVVLRLWQSNMVGLQAEQTIAWAVRPDAVAWLAGGGSPA